MSRCLTLLAATPLLLLPACGGGGGDGGGGSGPLTLAFGAPKVLTAGAIGATSQLLVVTDLDKDTDVDVAVANTGDNAVGVFLNGGGGALANQVNHGTDTSPLALGAGLLNNDTHVDLASANGNNSLSLLPNSGALGVFNGKQDAALTNTPTGIAVADVDGDGDLDLTFPHVLGGLKVAFRGAAAYTVQDFPGGGKLTNPKGAAVADFDASGRPDIAVADSGGDRVAVWFNSGNAGSPFPSAGIVNTLTLPPGSMPQGLAVGDFNGDGKPDLVVPNPGNNSKSVTVFLNLGAGAFAPGVTSPGGSDSFQAAVADFDRDGRQDVAVLDFLAGNVAVLRGKGDGTFEAQQLFTVGKDGANATILPRSIATGDVNGDSLPDVVVASDLNQVVVVLLNTSS